MPITFVLPNGDTEVVNDFPANVTCQQYITDQAVVELPADALEVLHNNTRVNEQPLAKFDGQKLHIVKKVVA